MKKMILLLFLAGTVIGLFAQNDEKEILGKYSVVQLPLDPFPTDYKNLKVDVTTSDLYLRDAIMSKMYITGYKKLDKNSTDAADIVISVEAYPFQIAPGETYSYVNTTKVDGVEKKQTLWGYKGSVKYKFNIVMKGRNDSIYYESQPNGTQELSGSGYASGKDAAAYLASDKEGTPGEIVENIFGSYPGYLSNRFGFVKKQFVPFTFTVKVSKKCKFDYSDLLSAHELVKSSFMPISISEDNASQFLTAVAPAIEKWENALKEANPEDKKARINKDLTCAILHNLGMVYFLGKEYEKAIDYFGKCIEVKKSYGDASQFKGVSEDLLKRIKINAK
jgi:tetratricopeptide (TPR) repeat protein